MDTYARTFSVENLVTNTTCSTPSYSLLTAWYTVDTLLTVNHYSYFNIQYGRTKMDIGF